MKLLRRILLIVVVVVLVLVIAGGATVAWMIRSPYPQTSGTLNVPGLEGTVTIYRDNLGIPHIYAENEHDMFFAQGYVHAQDRFWQMEFWRHVSSGRISEIAGSSTVETDTFIRTMGWNRMTDDIVTYYAENDPEMMTVLEDYSEGVNAYINANRDNLSFDMKVMQMVNEPWEIEPWTPANTVGWGVVMADDLSGNYGEELDRAQMIQELGAAKMAELFPAYPTDTRPVIAPTADQYRPDTTASTPASLIDWGRVSLNMIANRPPSGFAFGSGDWIGSNNWVVGGDLTASGEPLLANDPHLQMSMPSIWYQVGLHAPGYDAVGFSFAGVPGVVVGHNNNIAWGVTTSYPDVQDLYVEKINPDNPNQYEYMGQWEDMKLYTEVIKVNGGDPVTVEVQETRHGPIVTQLFDRATQPLALRWSAAVEPSRILRAVISLNKAENYTDFRTALQFWDMPSQNFVYADKAGNIAYQMPGRIPNRTWDGATPVPGWTGEYEWDGWVPFEDLPALFNPEKGYIITANNAVVDSDYPYPIGGDWDNGDRAQRIQNMFNEALANDGKIDIPEIQAMQFDAQTLLAVDYLPLLTALQSDTATTQAALDRLKGWDAELRRDSVPALIWETFQRELAYAVVADDYGDLAEDYIGGNTRTRLLLHQLAAEPDSDLWDDSTTAATESRDAILLRAMDATVANLTADLGGNMDDWTWGKKHVSLFVSNPLGQSGVDLIEGLVNRGPFPTDGGSSVPNANGYSWANPAQVTGHVSMRMIVDFSNFNESLSIQATGQSGHPYHPHYDDMIQMWLNGEYQPMRWDRSTIESEATETLTLTP